MGLSLETCESQFKKKADSMTKFPQPESLVFAITHVTFSHRVTLGISQLRMWVVPE